MKKFVNVKKVICLAVTLCIGLFGAFMIGCNDDEDEYIYEPPKSCDVVLEYTWFYWAEECKDFIGICNTYDEFKEVCLRNGYGSFESEQVRDYIAGHSADKSLVVCVLGQSCYGGQYRVKEVEVVDGKLTMYIRMSYDTFPKGTCETAMNIVFLVAGIDKSVASGITELKYIYE